MAYCALHKGNFSDKDNCPHCADPAESQGVERAHPVEGPREITKHCSCRRNMPYFDWTHDAACEMYIPAPVSAPVEGVERVTEVAPGEYERYAPQTAYMKRKSLSTEEQLSAAETRIEVLEAALRAVQAKCDEVAAFELEKLLPGPGGAFARKFVNELIAALAAPSGEHKEKV